VDVDGSLRRAAFRAAVGEAAASVSSPNAAAAVAAAAQASAMSSSEREPNGIAPTRGVVTTPSISYASIATNARRIECNDGRHKAVLVLRCHQRPGMFSLVSYLYLKLLTTSHLSLYHTSGFQVCAQTVGGFTDPNISSDAIEWRTTHDHHVITSLLVRIL
jgi:hypothetical protein